jgi:N-acetylmuramoyl-L-alanine amidase
MCLLKITYIIYFTFFVNLSLHAQDIKQSKTEIDNYSNELELIFEDIFVKEEQQKKTEQAELLKNRILNIKLISKPIKQNIIYETPKLGALISSIEEVSNKAKPIIVIDAGHGGKDPGAIGYNKVKEKDIVLSYAKILARKLRKKNLYKVYLTRDKDKFLRLRQRNQLARQYKANLFISIHADAARNKKARGLSIYRLSKISSDKEAALLAKKENRSDIIAGVDLSEVSKDVSKTLIDLSMRDAKNESIIFAKLLHKHLKNKVLVRKEPLRYAGFAVLKNSNMASILLEIGYLSNRYDTKNLKQFSYKKKLTNGIVKAIDEYFGN